MTAAPIPTGPIHTAPVGYLPTTEQAAALRHTLAAAGIELGDYDERIITWLASWDWGTVATIASWITRAAAAPAADRAEHRDQVLAEGAELIRQHRGGLDEDAPWWDTRDRDTAAALLLAARTTTAPATQEG